MAKDELTGNMPTELMMDYFRDEQIATGINEAQFAQSMLASAGVFH